MGCLAKSKGSEKSNIPEIDKEDQNILNENLTELHKEELLCPKCGKVPEILYVHNDNAYIDLKCKSHGKISMKIQEYYEELDKSLFKPKCFICKKSQKDLEKIDKDKVIYYCYECKQDICQICMYDFENEKVKKLKHKSSHIDTCIETKEKYNKCLNHYYEEIT